MTKQRKNWIQVEGTIMIADQDRRGKILEIALETRFFEIFLFTGRGKGRELMTFLNHKVRIEGHTEGRDHLGRTLITVERYHVCGDGSSL